jgi:hypothetical protein
MYVDTSICDSLDNVKEVLGRVRQQESKSEINEKNYLANKNFIQLNIMLQGFSTCVPRNTGVFCGKPPDVQYGRVKEA